MSGPPPISTWHWSMATKSVAVLARLEPNVLARGHTRPMGGGDRRASHCPSPDHSDPGQRHVPGTQANFDGVDLGRPGQLQHNPKIGDVPPPADASSPSARRSGTS